VRHRHLRPGRRQGIQSGARASREGGPWPRWVPMVPRLRSVHSQTVRRARQAHCPDAPLRKFHVRSSVHDAGDGRRRKSSRPWSALPLAYRSSSRPASRARPPLSAPRPPLWSSATAQHPQLRLPRKRPPGQPVDGRGPSPLLRQPYAARARLGAAATPVGSGEARRFRTSLLLRQRQRRLGVGLSCAPLLVKSPLGLLRV
jgi:hypothetical protein